MEALWDHRIEAKCINFDKALIILSSFNIGTDILIICLPVTQLWKLIIPKRQKCQLIGMFFMGGLLVLPSMLVGALLMMGSVFFASIIRVPFIAHISFVDQTWSDIDGFIWSLVELCLGIVSACLPTLRPLFLHVLYGRYPATPKCQSPDCPNPGRKMFAEVAVSEINSRTEDSDTKTSEWV